MTLTRAHCPRQRSRDARKRASIQLCTPKCVLQRKGNGPVQSLAIPSFSAVGFISYTPPLRPTSRTQSSLATVTDYAFAAFTLHTVLTCGLTLLALSVAAGAGTISSFHGNQREMVWSLASFMHYLPFNLTYTNRISTVRDVGAWL